MITLAPDTKEAQESLANKYRWQVSFKRRFWNIETQTFDLEAASTILDREDVHDIGGMRDQLDRRSLNEFKNANVSIRLKNKDQIWSDKNPQGNFGIDSVARLGYESQLMEFRIDCFFEHEDGTESVAIPYFVGRAVAYDQFPAAGEVQITLDSKHVLLRRGNAEDVSFEDIDDDLVGTVDGVNDTFFSTGNGIGRVLTGDGQGVRIRPGAAPLRLGIDVKVDQLNDPDAPARFIFTTPPNPVTSDDPRADLRRWKQEEKIDVLVKDLAVAAGIPLTDQDVEAVVFATQVINTLVLTDQADWEAALSLQNILTTSTPGQFSRAWWLVDDFSDLDFSSSPTWTIVSNPFNRFTISAATGALVMSNSGSGSALIDIPMKRAFGTWDFELTHVGSAPGATALTIINFADGYSFQARNSLFGPQTFRVFEGSNVLIEGGGIDSGTHTWRITRATDGEFKLYKDGVQVGATVTDLTTTTTTTNFSISVATGADAPADSLTMTFDDFFYSTEVVDPTIVGQVTTNNLTAIWVNQDIDGGADFVRHLNIVTTTLEPVGTSVLIETATADEDPGNPGNPLPFGVFTAVGPAGQVLSLQKRFLRIRITPNTSGDASIDDFNYLTPTVFDLTVTTITTTTTIKLANFTNLTIFDAIKALGEIANYEWGLSREGRLFFRPRSRSTIPIETISLENLREISRISDGVDRVFNRISVKYGAHETIVDPLTQGDSSPNSFDRFGVRPLALGSNQLLIDPDADISQGLAKAYFADFKLPRRRFETAVVFAPHLELGDTIRLRIGENLPNPPWHIGDTSQFIGKKTIQFHGKAQQAAYEILARVLSVRNEKATMRTPLELEEII